MENVIEVSIATLEQDINTLQEILTSLKKTIREIDDIITSLNGMWDSESKRNLMKHYENDKQAFQTMFDNVDEVLESMQNARKAYERCEHNVYQKIRAIQI